LLQLFPRDRVTEVETAEYNRQTNVEWRSIRDFLILHYRANERDGPFWSACREMALPDSLTHKIELFRESGRIFRIEEELFTEPGWLQVMIGQGMVPRSHHPLADQLAPEQLGEFLGLIRKHVQHVAAGMPRHEDYVARHCAVPAAGPAPVARVE
jgi:tryptophan halogenase